MCCQFLCFFLVLWFPLYAVRRLVILFVQKHVGYAGQWPTCRLLPDVERPDLCQHSTYPICIQLSAICMSANRHEYLTHEFRIYVDFQWSRSINRFNIHFILFDLTIILIILTYNTYNNTIILYNNTLQLYKINKIKFCFLFSICFFFNL